MNASSGAHRKIRVGLVLRLFVRDTNPPKEKRFIVAGISEDKLLIATVYINSKINQKINWALELESQQVRLSSKGREFLEWDSYVDCSKLTVRDYSEIENIVKNRPETIIGELTPSDWEIIRNTIVNSPVIKGKQKKKFGFYI